MKLMTISIKYVLRLILVGSHILVFKRSLWDCAKKTFSCKTRPLIRETDLPMQYQDVFSQSIQNYQVNNDDTKPPDYDNLNDIRENKSDTASIPPSYQLYTISKF